MKKGTNYSTAVNFTDSWQLDCYGI
jgi:hypothetical protein